jgi:hypothetical protein
MVFVPSTYRSQILYSSRLRPTFHHTNDTIGNFMKIKGFCESITLRDGGLNIGLGQCLDLKQNVWVPRSRVLFEMECLRRRMRLTGKKFILERSCTSLEVNM